MDNIQRLAADAEGSELPQEVEPAVVLLKNSFCVSFPVESVLQVNTQVSVILHHLYLFSLNGNGAQLIPAPPKILWK